MPAKLTLSSDLSNLISAPNYNDAKILLGLDSTASPSFSSLNLPNNTLSTSITGSNLFSAASGTFGTGAFSPLVTRATLGLETSDSVAFQVVNAENRISFGGGAAIFGDLEGILEQRSGTAAQIYQVITLIRTRLISSGQSLGLIRTLYSSALNKPGPAPSVRWIS